MSSAIAVSVPQADRFVELVGRLAAQQGFAQVVASLKAGHSATVGGVWGSSCALVAAALAPDAPGPLVVVCPRTDDLDDFCDDLALFSRIKPERFPAWEDGPRERLLHDDIYGDRLRLLKQLLNSQHDPQTIGDAPRLIVTSIQSLLQPVPRRETLTRQTRRVRAGDAIDVQELLTWMVEQGFTNTSAVELPGEFSARGGILDIFAPDWYDPVRVEFFGDTIESIRRFEVASQRSLATADAIDITILSPSPDDREHFTGYLPAGSWFFLVEPADLEEEGRHYLDRLDRPQDFHSISTTMRQVVQFPSVAVAGIPAGSMETTCHLQIESVERFSGDVGKVRDELDSAMGAGDGGAMGAADGTTSNGAADNAQEVFIVCQTEAEI